MKINNFKAKLMSYPGYAILLLSIISFLLVSCGPLKPKKVDLNAPVFLSEDSAGEESSVQVSLSQWCLITKDKEFVIPKDWIVTFMEPVDRLLGMYEESLND